MSRTTGRTMDLLGLLHSGRTWTGAELRRRLGISERTLRRDIDDLRGLGYGIDAVRGVGGGYRLGVGASLPPLILSEDEAVAVGIGLRVGASAGVIGLDDASSRALAKLQLSLSAAARQRIALVAEAMLDLGGAGEPVELETVTFLARAIRESRRIRVDYATAHSGRRRRILEPQRLVRATHRWYVIAWDAERSRWRTLRVDRMTPRPPLGARVAPRPIPEEELRRFVSWALGVAPYPVRSSVRMHASVDELRRHYPPDAARLVDLGDGTTRVDAGARDAAELRAWFDAAGVTWEHLDGVDVGT